jgi:hypothetical protein
MMPLFGGGKGVMVVRLFIGVVRPKDIDTIIKDMLFFLQDT